MTGQPCECDCASVYVCVWMDDRVTDYWMDRRSSIIYGVCALLVHWKRGRVSVI